MIELKHVSKVFETAGGRVEALKDISLTIPDGDVYGIIGMSGAGKSTLVRCINLLEEADSGHIWFDGQDLMDLKVDLNALRQKIGMVFQGFNLFNNKSVLDNCTLAPMTVRHIPRAQAEETAIRHLKAVGLEDFIHADSRRLSGGQKQRLCIARTLLKRPKILIFDDSTSAVDTATEGKIRTALAELWDVTKLIIAQRIASVQDADRIIVMEGGRIAAVGTHEELLKTSEIYREVYESQTNGGDENA